MMMNMKNDGVGVGVVVGSGGSGGAISLDNNSNNVSLKSGGDGTSDNFPAGLRVLVVDDDPTCLKILEKMLRNCLYEVSTCTRAERALSILRDKKYVYDLVLSDVHMPDMDGFKLLEHIGLEMDLPVLMMSVDDKPEVVMKGVTHGACDYLIKPIRIEALKTIWQHVVRRKKHELKEFEQSDSMEDGDRLRKASEDADYASSGNDGSWRNTRKRKDEDDDADERDDSSTTKKPRVVWSVELHQQFVAAVGQLGIDKAVPKKILELMNVPGLTRENVASHLQKYRLYLKRVNVESHQTGLNTSFLGEANFGSMSSVDGFNFQNMSVPGQLPLHSLAALRRGLTRSSSHTGISMQHVDQRKLLSADTSRLRFGSVQQQPSRTNQGNLLHGFTSSIDTKQQLSHLQHPAQPFGNIGQVSEGTSGFMNLPMASQGTGSLSRVNYVGRNQGNSPMMQQMVQSQVRGQLINGIPLSMGGQQVFPNDIMGQVLGGNGSVINSRGVASQNSLPQTSPMVGMSMNQMAELPGNGFRFGSSAGESSLQSTITFQGGGSIEAKGSRGFNPNYDILDELQKVGQTFETSGNAIPIQRSADPSFSGLGQQAQKIGDNVKIPILLREEETQPGKPDTTQPNNQLQVDMRGESFPDFGCDILSNHWDQDDFLTALYKQGLPHPDGTGSIDSDFNFDGLDHVKDNSI